MGYPKLGIHVIKRFQTMMKFIISANHCFRNDDTEVNVILIKIRIYG